jgi:predicted RNase H-like HicB family nuclease
MTERTLRYTVLIYSDDGAYSVRVPSLPGCVTFGRTVDEALAMARDAIAVYVATLRDRGDEVPEEDGVPLVTILEVPTDEPATAR